MPRWPVYIVLALLVSITAVFIIVFVSVSSDSASVTEADMTAYPGIVSALLLGADPERGEQLIQTLACPGCHIATMTSIAPPFEGVAARAADRRPPLTAAEYIYESIANPKAYVVENYPDNMPKLYPEQLTDAQLGDLIAYLLTLDVETG